ncbi:hypothetical protein [Acidithiobacillus thiooxidans]|uniref:hypothetical protein n=1 Tax=Acidithiobacillus thiooxidans TaxID=930 RepID=UPI001C073B64|nr:hypothetical protein [Acidithiobacillus thiooxidans]MBU2843543.1 hypothetical protein [Acidithiobacillus thiooxidans]
MIESFFDETPEVETEVDTFETINAHDLPVPLNPVPKNKTTCDDMLKAYMAKLPFDEPLNTPVLRWIAALHNEPVVIHARYFVKVHVGKGYGLIAHACIDNQDKQTVFSFRRSIDVYYGASKKRVLASQYAKHLDSAMRQEIQYQIDEWRRNNGNLPEMDVDHIYPFVALVRDFLRIEGAMMRYGDGWHDEALSNKDELAMVEFDDGTPESFYRHTLRDRALAARWRAYHQKHARLQWLTKKENSSKGAKILDDVTL